MRLNDGNAKKEFGLKLMVMGYKRHGKDSFCEYLRDEYGVTFASSSYTACELFLFDELKDRFGYGTVLEAFNDRGAHRDLWYNSIKAYNEKHGLDALGKHIYTSNDVYCGIRDREEFYALKKAGYFDLSIWVDAGKRLPPESQSSMNLTPDDADLIITNNDSLSAFHAKIQLLYSVLCCR